MVASSSRGFLSASAWDLETLPVRSHCNPRPFRGPSACPRAEPTLGLLIPQQQPRAGPPGTSGHGDLPDIRHQASGPVQEGMEQAEGSHAWDQEVPAHPEGG